VGWAFPAHLFWKCARLSAPRLAHDTCVARSEASQLRKDELGQEVRQIVQELHRQGKLPAMAQVVSLLCASTLREWKALKAAFNSATEEIEQE
jgi:hypothetical protein